MKVVFAGPTISHSEVQQHLDCVCMPPVCHGDLIALIKQKPDAIGIIDGYFEGAPSVWHKEILYALDQGVHVYGSASMGALRAAELHIFGMRGVGRIFEWYRDLFIEDDDEVAVLHGPAEVGFAAASEPMVSIRATLQSANQEGVIERKIHDDLIDAMKGTFYKKRSWKLVREFAAELLDDAARSQFNRWLDQHCIDLKKQDAIAMLNVISNEHNYDKPAFEAKFNFEWTNVWDTAFRNLGVPDSTVATLTENDHMVLDQLRLNPSEYARFRDKAVLAWICGQRVNTELHVSDVQQELKNFRKANLLHSRPQLLNYLSEIELDESGLTKAMQDSARVRKVTEAAGDQRHGIINQLKLEGQYLDFLTTAERKQGALRSAGLNPDQPGVFRPQLVSWFSKRVTNRIPEDLTELLSSLDLQHVDDFYRLIAGDYLYWRISH